ncbi:MAG: FMN-binding negative transcriptional regulator [Flavobacterium sp.]|nr:FMN-binding negative transcriptional regulator [Flavobacterium sp.]
MYIPDIYKNHNQAEIEGFLKNNSFGILVNQTNGRLWATHIPLELEHKNGKAFLCGHISKENPQWEGFTDNNQVLAVFSGPHAYISSSWYDHENVPTWNYIAVHVYGKVKIVDEKTTIAMLKQLVDKYESNSENPVRIENLSKKTMLQARGIVGFEIEIESIEATRKMSQNRNEKNYNTIIEKLSETKTDNGVAVAEEMRRCPIHK